MNFIFGNENYPPGTTNKQAEAAAVEVREYDPVAFDAEEEAERQVRSWFGGGGLTMLLLSFPVVLFDIAWWVAWTILPLPYRTMGDKIVFYGALIVSFQIAYAIMSMGYGIFAIPSSALSFYLLVWVF